MVPGTASHRTIEHNHGLSLKYKAEPGKSDNPIHRDLEEVLRFVPIHFLLNTIVDIDKNVLEAVAGDVMEAHRAGISLASQRFVVPTEEELYDVVIASPGGDPKDKQMYQAIKSMKNAAAFTKPGGTIIIAAQCSEMLGNGTLQYWVDTMPSRDWMVRKLKEQFVIGAHKILHIDESLQQRSGLPVFVVAELFTRASRVACGTEPSANDRYNTYARDEGRNHAVCIINLCRADIYLTQTLLVMLLFWLYA
ncbi:hypothetical protein RAC89_13015 [Paenibacillus sp. GD4]|uniref:hypothetical protein n=1 Tax=Paenibacillus sp. GD4 TaxID=3068890 RepID=UPI0027965FF9|nr:hypothetical protein [Paenibacillus sp. GD4]MDQ1911356.1 hypothetical protein [Paenibacillus sp. GD4]